MPLWWCITLVSLVKSQSTQNIASKVDKGRSIFSSAGAGENCVLPTWVASCSPVLDKIRTPMGPENPVLGQWGWGLGVGS